MPRITHFEITAERPERAITFYREALGWSVTKWGGGEEYWLLTTGDKSDPGINGGLMQRTEQFKGTINTVDVQSLSVSMKRVTSAGGTLITPRIVIPGVGYMVYCHDTEGNVFGMMQSDPDAH
jgi:predicted enzyme related to lactoylglutathione lyase